jgi:putative FmdB family regulatory protein
MPIYGYTCKQCSRSFQTLVRSDEVPACPACGSENLLQELSLIAAPTKSTAADAPACEGGSGSCGMCCGMNCD